ncbi:hypothetical protein NP233_g10207 [Leucocoprinus birnbaumii]|uniref:Nephrocystin 3-like N-terminal domain-containing protein n=1 Tax=Leucocoprinus birnbaumii TaxID=56174 RepID=A0AAD5VJ04_9AGAR|nr:hypothetical protein NP233_g10207 [Leucocoprinus birnbaumii]
MSQGEHTAQADSSLSPLSSSVRNSSSYTRPAKRRTPPSPTSSTPPRTRPPPAPSCQPSPRPRTPSLLPPHQNSPLLQSPNPAPLLQPTPSDTWLAPPTPPRILPSRLSTPLQRHVPRLSETHEPCIPTTRHADLSQLGSFNQASNFIISNSQFNDYSLIGLELLRHSMPDAFHDSAARFPPPKCHLGTRKDYIKQIMDWATGESEHKEPVLWMRGPFGIGTSAVAQSSSEALKPFSKLLATLFFSRSNADRDDSRRVFPSLVYQITTLCKEFATIIDARIRDDLAVTTKSLATQFEELIVIPLSQIDTVVNGLDGGVIILDGLDECRGIREQCEIIRIITNSSRNGTTPFRWFITSRPEDPIIRTMNSPAICPAVYFMELPVSRSIDREILIFLVDEFAKIRESHGLPGSWPSDGVLALLVERGAGLWIYVATIVRFINDENSLGPEEQLQIVLEFIGDVLNKVDPNNPFAVMDFFYTLIMQRVPSNILEMIQKILFLHSLGYSTLIIVATLLHFYNASFVDYLRDHKRSGVMCIYGDFLVRWRKELLDPSCNNELLRFFAFYISYGYNFTRGNHTKLHYRCVLLNFWTLVARPDHEIDFLTAAFISNFPFQKMLRLIPQGEYSYTEVDKVQGFRENLPIEFRDKVFRSQKCPSPGCTATNPVWILGSGDNEVIIGTSDANSVNLCFGDDQDETVHRANDPKKRMSNCYRIIVTKRNLPYMASLGFLAYWPLAFFPGPRHARCSITIAGSELFYRCLFCTVLIVQVTEHSDTWRRVTNSHLIVRVVVIEDSVLKMQRHPGHLMTDAGSFFDVAFSTQFPCYTRSLLESNIHQSIPRINYMRGTETDSYKSSLRLATITVSLAILLYLRLSTMPQERSTAPADGDPFSSPKDSPSNTQQVIQQRPVPLPPCPTSPRTRRPPPPPPRQSSLFPRAPSILSPPQNSLFPRAPPPPPRPKPLAPTRLPPPIPPRTVPSRVSTPLESPTPQLVRVHESNTSAAGRTNPDWHGQFYQAHDFTITNAHFRNEVPLNTGPGLKTLFENSMPDAFHDSLARYPPPKCHLGTREEYIKEITNWALGQSERKEPVLWMQGPFGIGKTAVAQSSAEALKLLDKLLATLFFSRSHEDRDDPRRVIPSLVYQITTHCEQFANIIDERLRKDQSLTTKMLSTQFDELLVIPLRQLDAAARTSLEGHVIIIDGLDECRGSAEQCEIIRIIATSAQNRTTPFRWFITSPPVSREIDHEILLFLTDEFAKMRESHGLPEAWPSDKVLALLVERTAGLWIYVATIVRFINNENSLGPEDQLEIVLRFISDVSKKVEPNNPLAEMDFFYTLIMERVPSNMLEMVRRIVLVCSIQVRPKQATAFLGLSFQQLRRYCAFIQSVMELKGTPMEPSLSWRFYHTSFGDYLKDCKRSGAMCIYEEFLSQRRKELLEWYHFVCSHTKDSSQLEFPDGTTLPEGISRRPMQPIDVPTAEYMSKLPFQKMFRITGLVGKQLPLLPEIQMRSLRENLPVEFRNRIIRRQQCPAPGCTAAGPVRMLGHGDDEVFLSQNEKGNLCVRYDQNGIPLPTGNCPCGARFEDVEEVEYVTMKSAYDLTNSQGKGFTRCLRMANSPTRVLNDPAKTLNDVFISLKVRDTGSGFNPYTNSSTPEPLSTQQISPSSARDLRMDIVPLPYPPSLNLYHFISSVHQLNRLLITTTFDSHFLLRTLFSSSVHPRDPQRAEMRRLASHQSMPTKDHVIQVLRGFEIMDKGFTEDDASDDGTHINGFIGDLDLPPGSNLIALPDSTRLSIHPEADISLVSTRLSIAPEVQLRKKAPRHCHDSAWELGKRNRNTKFFQPSSSSSFVVPQVSHAGQSAQIIGGAALQSPPVLTAQPLPASLQSLRPDFTSDPVPVYHVSVPPSYTDNRSTVEHHRFTHRQGHHSSVRVMSIGHVSRLLFPRRIDPTGPNNSNTRTIGPLLSRYRHFFAAARRRPPVSTQHLSMAISLTRFRQLSEPTQSPCLQPSIPEAPTSQRPSSLALPHSREYVVPHQSQNLGFPDTQSINEY